MKVNTVKPNSVVSVEISGAFLNMLNNTFANYLSSFPNEEVIEAFIEVGRYKNDDITKMSQFAQDIFTLNTLISVITDRFKEKGLISQEELSTPEEGSVID